MTDRVGWWWVVRPDSQVMTNEARKDHHNKKQARDTCIYLVLKTRNTKQGVETRYMCDESSRSVTIFQPHFTTYKSWKFSISLHHWTTRKSGRLHVFPLTSHHCPFLFKSTTRLPVDGSTWTLYHPYSARVHWTTPFVTETSCQFKEWYSESLQQILCTQNKTKKLYFRTAIKFTYRLALTWKVEHEGGSFVSRES